MRFKLRKNEKKMLLISVIASFAFAVIFSNISFLLGIVRDPLKGILLPSEVFIPLGLILTFIKIKMKNSFYFIASALIAITSLSIGTIIQYSIGSSDPYGWFAFIVIAQVFVLAFLIFVILINLYIKKLAKFAIKKNKILIGAFILVLIILFDILIKYRIIST